MILLGMGLGFLAFGLLALCLFVVAAEGEEMVMSFIICAAFCLVGAFLISFGLREILRKRTLIAVCKPVRGKIIEYDDNTQLTINGMYALALLVEIPGYDKPYFVRTSTTKESKFPIGSSVDIIIDPEGGEPILRSKKGIL